MLCSAVSRSWWFCPSCWGRYAIGADMAPKGLPRWLILPPDLCLQCPSFTWQLPHCRTNLPSEGRDDTGARSAGSSPGPSVETALFSAQKDFTISSRVQRHNTDFPVTPITDQWAIIAAPMFSTRSLRSQRFLLLWLPQQAPAYFYRLY